MKQLFGVFLLAGLCPVTAIAQEAEPGGVFFTFDIDQSFEATSDRDLATPEEEEGFDSITGLQFGAVTETRTDRLSFDLGTGFRAADGEVTSDETSIRLAYNRNSADAMLDLSASAVRSEIEFLRDASDFVNADGEVVLPDDFEDLTGTGSRTASTLAANFRWGETDPVGYRIGLSGRTLRYEDASAALVDTDIGSVTAGVRLNINEVTTSNLDLTYTQTDETGEPIEDRTTLGGGLTFARPLGDLTTRISVSRDEADETFWAASVNRRLELPRSTLEGSLGLVEDESGEARLTGSIDYTFPRPTGQIDLSAERSLSPGDDRSATTVSANYGQNISPVSNVQFGIVYGEASDSDGSDPLATGSLSASYGIALTPVWQLNLGARANIRDDDGSRSRSNTLFLALNRGVSWRP